MIENRPLIGFTCAYTPLAMIDAAGFTPYRVLPLEDLPDRAATLLHDNLCPHVKKVLDRALSDEVPTLSGMVFMNSCDSMRRLYDAWQIACPDVEAIMLELPVTTDIKAINFFEKELELFENGLLEVLPLAEELQICLLVEPEPELLIENSHQFLSFIEKFDSKYVGLNFDIGHFFCVNEDPAKLIHQMQNYIHHIHLEDINSSRIHHHLIPGYGSIDFQKIFNSLNQINYNGFITVELYPYQENPQQAAIESMNFINSILENV